jgi:hypothetical protein
MGEAHRPDRRGWYVDAAWYAASTIFAVLVWRLADVPLQRSWGGLAVWSYLGASVVALALSRSSLSHGARIALAVAALLGATLAPLAIAVADRGPGDRGATAQSEVLIVEEAATTLLDGRDPYTQAYDRGPLADRPGPTRTHVAYPPGIFVFGVPKALAGPGPLTDARVWFLAASLAIALPSLRRMRTDGDGRLLVFQVLFVLPTGAMPLATGGHDVPVLAALLASVVLAGGDRATASGLAAGAALAMRQTTILALPFLAAITPPARRPRQVAVALVPALAASVPFLLWDAAAFIEDVVRFPLGLGTGRSSARTPTLGSALLDLVPSARTAVTIALVVSIAVIVVALVAIRSPRTAADACVRMAAAYGAAIALAPAARFGYLIYPLSFLAWAAAFARGSDAERPAPTEDLVVARRAPDLTEGAP